MGKLLLFAGPVTVALVLGLAVYALPASGTSTSLISRVARLEATTKALKAQNTNLAKRLSTIENFVAGCMTKAGVEGVTAYGNSPGGQGYLYTNDNGATVVATTALDVTQTGETPAAFVQLIDPSCVGGTTPAAKSATSLRRPAALHPLRESFVLRPRQKPAAH